jgi:hypothetical protein
LQDFHAVTIALLSSPAKEALPTALESTARLYPLENIAFCGSFFLDLTVAVDAVGILTSFTDGLWWLSVHPFSGETSMRLASDYIHPYKDAGGRPARCRVRIYLPDDVRDAPVVICSELPKNLGGSITNSAEVIAAGVIRANELPTPLVWIEH